MRIAIVTSNYPWPERPYCGAFVRGLVWEFARQGHVCSVIAPSSIWDKIRFGKLGPLREIEAVPRSHVTVSVVRPRIVSTSAMKLGRFNSIEMSDYMFTKAVVRELNQVGSGLDFVYAHFLYPGGKAAAYCSRLFDMPYIVAHGDFEIDRWYMDKGVEHFRNVAGVVAVSKLNARFCSEVFQIKSSKIAVFPNGVDHKLFFPRHRMEARKSLDLPLDVNIAVFVGRFDSAKGPDRVAQAIKGLPNTLLMMIGHGPIEVRSEKIVFRGVVDHERLPVYLSAADFFVLPTTGEGSSNAILEAMACGLPIVSSSGEFNDDILNHDVSIRVDPLDVDELQHAIEKLSFNFPLRQRMSESCLLWSKRFSIENRAKSIMAWASQKAEEWRHNGGIQK